MSAEAPHAPEEVRRILEERARALARPPEAQDGAELLGAVAVVVGRERYAIELRHVVGIEPLAGLTPLPGVPSFWAGLANVRGTLHPILDLREYLGAAVAEDPTERKLVLVHGAGVSIALLADDVLDVIWIRGDALGPSPHAADTRAVVRGVTADLMALLDLEVLLSDPGLVVDDEAT